MNFNKEQIASELGIVKSLNCDCNWNKTLHYCEFGYQIEERTRTPTTDADNLLFDVLNKILKRGIRPFCSFELEEKILEMYGGPFEIKISKKEKGAITYSHTENLKIRYQAFTDVIDAWNGRIESISFDPNSSHHERDFLANLAEHFPDNIVNMIRTQVPISEILAPGEAGKFKEQRVDFFLTFPNGESIVLEPGDHESYTESLQILDRQRDDAFFRQGIPTKRLENSEIEVEETYREIKRLIDRNGGGAFLRKQSQGRDATALAENYLFLLPSLVARIEYLLTDFYFMRGLVHEENLNVGFIEQDLECAVIAFRDFESWVKRLVGLYGLDITLPRVTLFIKNNPNYAITEETAKEDAVIYVESFDEIKLDLLLDVAIKSNNCSKPAENGAPYTGSVRQAAPSNKEVRFSYKSIPQPIVEGGTDAVLETFLRDFFRKWSFREGQLPIIKNILLQKNTIGLLPTSAGKSICYQLASILTPGTSIVIDPITSLMQNQADSLRKNYGIDRTFAWYAQSSSDQNISHLLYSHIMVFVSPERLQRKTFRSAMQNLKAADIRINYAIIDEAHCISMWGHDFRPSYLMLESNVRKYCTFNSKTPPIVALTGTASQLVLIDMKRELRIAELDSIVRPKSFNRPELTFNIINTNADNKLSILKTLEISIARRLNVRDLASEAYGIVFSYKPKELWELLQEHLADTVGHINDVLNNGNFQTLKYGMYCGSKPEGFPPDRWEEYKEKILNLFQDGKVRMLFGNNAISVGIDNQKINYIINYRLPQSMEAYYQQCGRAGREGQKSECYLIFSDDNPQRTKDWLKNRIPLMGKRFDDLGIVSYFHHDNFPGKETDIAGTEAVFSKIFKSKNEITTITADLDGKSGANSKKTEKYIAYLTMMGIINDYEVEGWIENPRYKIKISEPIVNFLGDNDQSKLEAYLIERLADYLNRNKPTTVEDVRRAIGVENTKPLSSKCIAYLLDYIYESIEYQRRKAIETVVDLCNENDTNPERLRARIVAYFDSSEKFSQRLLAMAESQPSIDKVLGVLDLVENFEDGEILYYETRRFLDERMRPDWLAANIFAYIFREKGKLTNKIIKQKYLDELISVASQLYNTSLPKREIVRFLLLFLSKYMALDKVFKVEIGVEIISTSIFGLFKHFGREIFEVIDQLMITQEEKEQVKFIVASWQLKEITNGRYQRLLG